VILGIKIYRGDGTLKKEISNEEALNLYNETNKEDWCLSPSERIKWNGFKLDDKEKPGRYERKGLQPWIKRTHTVHKQYEINCIVCNEKTIKASIDAKYCGKQCYGIARRRAANKKYKQRK